MYWFMDSRFNPAYDMAKQVVDEMNYKKGVVDINEIVRVVEKLKKVDIKIGKDRFETINKDCKNYGAAMSVERISTADCDSELQYKAIILLNNAFPYSKMRFSLAHELGHIMAQIPGDVDNAQGQLVVSTHINANITSIPITDKSSAYLVSEQMANIFALLVLMPRKVFTVVCDLLQDKHSVAEYFGVDEEAVESRLKLER